jgi:hypothetical protein
MLEEGLGYFREHVDQYVVATSLNYLGEAARLGGELEEAQRWYEDALTIYQQLGDGVVINIALLNLGATAYARGGAARATALYTEATGAAYELADREGIAYGLAGLAGMSLDSGQTEAAARLLGCAAAMTTASGAVLEPSEQAAADRVAAAAREALGAAAFDVAWAAGEALTLDEAIAAAEGISLDLLTAAQSSADHEARQ